MIVDRHGRHTPRAIEAIVDPQAHRFRKLLYVLLLFAAFVLAVFGSCVAAVYVFIRTVT